MDLSSGRRNTANIVETFRDELRDRKEKAPMGAFSAGVPGHNSQKRELSFS